MKLPTSRLCLCRLYLLLITVANVTADVSPPRCVLRCAAAIPNATKQSQVCTDVVLQSAIGVCLAENCTIKEILISQNITATTCQWPIRDQSSLCRNVAVSLLIPASLAVAARIVARMPRYSGPLGTDDYVIMATWVLLVTFTVLIWIITEVGLGKDIWTLPFDYITLALKYFNILTYIYILLTWLTKISVLFLYLRLFPDFWFRNIVKIAIVACSILGWSFDVACILRCNPVRFAWTFWDHEHEGRCTDILLSAQGWPHVFVNIFADLVVLSLPMPTLWKLNLPLEKKLSVMAMFSVGFFVTAISIYRATTFPRLVGSNNFTWDWTQSGMWSAIEVYVGVICACMPGLRAFYTKVFPGHGWTKTSNRSEQSHTSSSDPSSLGTAGSNSRLMDKFRRDPGFELITSERAELIREPS